MQGKEVRHYFPSCAVKGPCAGEVRDRPRDSGAEHSVDKSSHGVTNREKARVQKRALEGGL